MSQEDVDVQDIINVYSTLICKEGTKELKLVNEIHLHVVTVVAVVYNNSEEIFSSINPQHALDEYNKI